jgi:hypothetical protein
MESTRVTIALAVAAVVVTSGCIGFVTGEEALTYEANEAGVSADAKQATGYELQNRETVTINSSVSGRELRIVNRIARYEKFDPVAEETTGVLAVISTHRVDVFGHTTNPVENMTYSELLSNLTADYDTEFGTLGDATLQENRTRTVLGQEARVGVFTTTTEWGGEQVEVKLYVTRVQHGDDFVIAIGGHPTKLPAGEQEILRLIDGLTHQTDADLTNASSRAPVNAAGTASVIAPPAR